MPIYEFYCDACNTLFNFFSKTINTSKLPDCPKCGRKELERQMSRFAVTGKATEDTGMDELPMDERKMERAMEMIAREADKINEEDPRQAANLMRRLSDLTGLEMGAGMNEALKRLENGDDPEQIEAEMGSLLEGEEPFIVPEKKKGGGKQTTRPFIKDETLYDL